MTNDNAPAFFYFDMGNVLLSFDYDIAAARMAQVCGASPEVCRKVGYEGELYLQMETGEISSEEFHQRFSEATGTTSDRDALLGAPQRHVFGNCANRPHRDAAQRRAEAGRAALEHLAGSL